MCLHAYNMNEGRFDIMIPVTIVYIICDPYIEAPPKPEINKDTRHKI